MSQYAYGTLLLCFVFAYNYHETFSIRRQSVINSVIQFFRLLNCLVLSPALLSQINVACVSVIEVNAIHINKESMDTLKKILTDKI